MGETPGTVEGRTDKLEETEGVGLIGRGRLVRGVGSVGGGQNY